MIITNEEKYDHSIAFLKVLLSFCVVCCHFWLPGNLSFYPVAALDRMRGVAAPMFFIVSFFLASRFFAVPSARGLINRLKRLYSPYIVWPLVYFLVYIAALFVIKVNDADTYIMFPLRRADIVTQLYTGSDKNLCPQLWFQFAIIVVTLVLWCIYRLSGRHATAVMITIALVSLWLQYSEINYHIFSRYSYEVCYSLGRLAEVFPYAVVGMLLYKSSSLHRERRNRIPVVILCIAVMLFISYIRFIPSPDGGFAYSGLNKLVYATLAFIAFKELPLDYAPERFKKVIRFLAKYSLGVYCIHYGLGYCWDNIICVRYHLRQDTFMQCIVIYAVSILLSWLISLIPMRIAQMVVE